MNSFIKVHVCVTIVGVMLGIVVDPSSPVEKLPVADSRPLYQWHRMVSMAS